MHPARQRRHLLERLEPRQLLAGDWHNLYTPLDVNDDLAITPADALSVIIAIATARESDQSFEPSPGTYPDVNDDGRVSPLDALQVIQGYAENPNASVLRFTNDNGDHPRDGRTSDLALEGYLRIEPEIRQTHPSLRIYIEAGGRGGSSPLDQSDGFTGGVFPSRPYLRWLLRSHPNLHRGLIEI